MSSRWHGGGGVCGWKEGRSKGWLGERAGASALPCCLPKADDLAALTTHTESDKCQGRAEKEILILKTHRCHHLDG